MIFLKRRSDFKSYKQLDTQSYSMVYASMGDDTSSLTADADGGDAGSFLVMDGALWLVSKVSPDDKIDCRPATAIFDRDIFFDGAGTTIGGFLQSAIQSNFLNQTDPLYRFPYLTIQNTDNTPFVYPGGVENVNDVFNLFEYIQMVREAHGVYCEISVDGVITIEKRARGAYNIPFGDGVSYLERENYGSADTIGKCTVLKNGTKTDYYLSTDGQISTTAPPSRIGGGWAIVSVADDATSDEMLQAAQGALNYNTGDYKVEFSSSRKIGLGDAVTMRIGGRTVTGRVSKVFKTDKDNLWHYVSGDLAVTLTDKLSKR